jgi:hypothetical protein
MFKMGLRDSFGHLKYKLWSKERSGARIDPNSLRANNMRHTIGKHSTRVTTLFQTSLQSKVYTRSYVPLELQKSQLWEFRDSHLGVLGQNAIWMWPLGRAAENIIRGKVVASPSLGHGESCEFEVARGLS